MPIKKKIVISLTEELHEALVREAESIGENVTTLVRTCIRQNPNVMQRMSGKKEKTRGRPTEASKEAQRFEKLFDGLSSRKLIYEELSSDDMDFYNENVDKYLGSAS